VRDEFGRKSALRVGHQFRVEPLLLEGSFPLLRKSWAWSIVFDRNEHEWHILCPSHLDVAMGLR